LRKKTYQTDFGAWQMIHAPSLAHPRRGREKYQLQLKNQSEPMSSSEQTTTTKRSVGS
jgi:hypothetical protein